MFRYYIYEVFTSNKPTLIFDPFWQWWELRLWYSWYLKIDYFDTAATVTTPIIAPVQLHFVKNNLIL